MRKSTERILTTHVGSLPRSETALEFLMQKQDGEPYDEAAFEAALRVAVDDVVRRQRDAGVDVVSDGEAGRITYSTYVTDRLSGFEGHVPRKPSLDFEAHPELARAFTRMMGQQTFKRAACVGRVERVDAQAVQREIGRLQIAVVAHGTVDAFMNAASPGVIAAFQPNRHYGSHEAYVDAIAAAIKPEYEAVHQAGLVLQLDCPDLAASRHMSFQDLTEAEFLRRAEYHVEALNAAVSDIPAEVMRMHLCWGNYEGPHDHDIPLEKILPIVLGAKPAAILFEAANPRHEHEWTVWRDAKIPEDKILVPGCIMSTTNYVEHPELVAQRICRFADIVGRERVLAGTDCGFGTFAGLWRVEPGVVYKKLHALAEGASIASRRLWGG